MIDQTTLDKIEIRDVIECWAIWRDTGQWDKLATTWHPGGIMNATWFQGPFEQFIDNAAKAWARGNMSSHLLGGTAIELAGTRAIAQTRLTIAARETVDGVLCDMFSIGRFYDFFERRDGRWAIVERQPTYEKDRCDPVIPGTRPKFDEGLLEQFPPGYRFLGYAQTRNGRNVARNLPGLRGPEIEALYARGERWLAGALAP